LASHERKASPQIKMTSDSSLPNGYARKAVEELGRWIVSGKFPDDEAMPNEASLADELGVSRTTLRDAIKVLSGKGLVRTARRYGTRVRPVDQWNLLDGDVVGWHPPDHPRIKRIFAETTELRRIVEPSAAALAAMRATETQVATLLAAARSMHPGDGHLQELFDADCLFHVTLLDATQNHVMRQLKPIIITTLYVSHEYGVNPANVRRFNRSGHIAVAEAIAVRDGDAARAAMADMLARNQSRATDYWTTPPS
jgi:GntR family galactonate operon transcriptional repressor